MSSSPTDPTSTTSSWTGSPSPAEKAGRTAVIACGAIAQPVTEAAARRGWDVDVHPLPPLLHNRPQQIAAAVEDLLDLLAPAYEEVVVGYADCGTYGALDEVCARRGLRRLAGLHCYDVYAGPERLRALFESQPGTYVMTDFLVRSFTRSVIAELGLDRHPELRDDYFGHYTRVVWLAQAPDEQLRALAREAAAVISLPLIEVPVGHHGLERELETLLGLRS